MAIWRLLIYMYLWAYSKDLFLPGLLTGGHQPAVNIISNREEPVVARTQRQLALDREN